METRNCFGNRRDENVICIIPWMRTGICRNEYENITSLRNLKRSFGLNMFRHGSIYLQFAFYTIRYHQNQSYSDFCVATKVYFHFHENSPVGPVMSLLIISLPSHPTSLNSFLSPYLLSRHSSPQLPLAFSFRSRDLHAFLMLPVHTTFQASLILPGLNIVCGMEIKLQISNKISHSLDIHGDPACNTEHTTLMNLINFQF